MERIAAVEAKNEILETALSGAMESLIVLFGRTEAYRHMITFLIARCAKAESNFKDDPLHNRQVLSLYMDLFDRLVADPASTADLPAASRMAAEDIIDAMRVYATSFLEI